MMVTETVIQAGMRVACGHKGKGMLRVLLRGRMRWICSACYTAYKAGQYEG